ASSRAVTAAAKPSRSTASAPPAGSLWASAAARISEPQRRISSCSSPTALFIASSERKELEQTSSASRSVACASVARSGRISCSTAVTPARASCQAASLPASPPPTTCTGRSLRFIGRTDSVRRAASQPGKEPAMLKPINPPTIAPPFSRYSQAVEVPAGLRWLHISGQVGVRPDGTLEQGFTAQAERAWDNLLAILAAAGMGPADVVKANVYLTRGS